MTLKRNQASKIPATEMCAYDSRKRGEVTQEASGFSGSFKPFHRLFPETRSQNAPSLTHCEDFA
jgi:hypothetical protein